MREVVGWFGRWPFDKACGGDAHLKHFSAGCSYYMLLSHLSATMAVAELYDGEAPAPHNGFR